jgi:hypothetical protein
MVQVGNINGYVYDDGVNTQLHVDLSHVAHNPDGSVTLLTDQLWMTDVGMLAGRTLSTFKGVADPRNWDDCSATKSFFVKMQEVPPLKAPNQWPKVIDETVRLQPGRPSSEVTARLKFDFANSAAIVQCSFDLQPPPNEIIVDKGWMKATEITATVTDVHGDSGPVTFFRIRSSKTIKFRDGRQAPDPILATVWGWGARRLVECAN